MFPAVLAPACQLTGTRQRDYNLSASVMAETLLRAREMTGADGIYVSRDNWIYHEALGGELSFPEDDESFATRPILGSLSGWRALSVPDPESAPGMRTVLAAARAVLGGAGGTSYIQANIDTGPFSLAAVLRGAEAFLMDLGTEDERDLRPFLEFCTDVVIAYGKAMIATGVHGIQFGDSTASLISPADYARFVLPYQRRALEALTATAEAHQALGGTACDLWIHICGKTDHILGQLRDLPFQGFEVDAKVPLPLARELLGPKIALKGNLDTTFLLQRSPQEVYDACIGILKGGGFSGPLSTGVILSPGCGVPRMTPLENVRAMLRASEDFRL
jgi:uroporphyrinogen decarboxylase